jgi:hypothetical protein
MYTTAISFMGWSEEQFWNATPRKFIAVRDEYKRTRNNELKLILRAIRPDIELSEEGSNEEEGMYIDEFGI